MKIHRTGAVSKKRSALALSKSKMMASWIGNLHTDAHEAIISGERFMTVQREKLNRPQEPQDHRPIELRHLCAAACRRISTESEEQTSSIELQERHCSQLTAGKPHWENAGIF